MMENTLISYSDVEHRVVEQGYDAVKNVLLEGTMDEKLRLLLCLEVYADPCAREPLPYAKKQNAFLKALYLENQHSDHADKMLRAIADVLHYDVQSCFDPDEEIEDAPENCVIKQGFAAVEAALTGGDDRAKRRLLHCLEWVHREELDDPDRYDKLLLELFCDRSQSTEVLWAVRRVIDDQPQNPIQRTAEYAEAEKALLERLKTEA